MENTKSTVEELRLILSMMAKGYKVPDIVYNTILNTAKREVENKNTAVLYKRDPNVHSRRIQGAYVKIVEEDTIQMYPSSTTGFGADFDGDSVLGVVFVEVYYKNTNNIKLYGKYDLNELIKLIGDIFIYIKYKEKEGSIIFYFNINELYDVYINSINIKNGLTENKNIEMFTIHTNLNMYTIEDIKNRFETFWTSDDHSLIIYNSISMEIEKISPIELIKDPNNKYLIKIK